MQRIIQQRFTQRQIIHNNHPLTLDQWFCQISMQAINLNYSTQWIDFYTRWNQLKLSDAIYHVRRSRDPLLGQCCNSCWMLSLWWSMALWKHPYSWPGYSIIVAKIFAIFLADIFENISVNIFANIVFENVIKWIRQHCD